MKDKLKVMDGTVLEKARLYFILEHKVRVSIIHLPLLCAVFLLCFKICFLFFKLFFKDSPALCCLIMPLLVNFLMLYFQAVCTVLFTYPLGPIKGAQPKESHFFRTNFPSMHNAHIFNDALFMFVCLSDILLQSHLLEFLIGFDDFG